MRFVVREIVIDSKEKAIAEEVHRQELLIEAPSDLVEHNDGGGASLTPNLMSYLIDQASEITGWCIVSCTIEEHTNDDGYPTQ
jgi:hypothetical protein